MSIYRAQHRLLGTHVRYWPLTKIISSTAPVRIRGLSRYQLCGGPFHCICPLMTQSGHTGPSRTAAFVMGCGVESKKATRRMLRSYFSCTSINLGCPYLNVM